MSLLNISDTSIWLYVTLKCILSIFNQQLLLLQGHQRNCALVSSGVPEDYDSSMSSDTSTAIDATSDLEAPAFSPITPMTSSEDECDESEDCSSINHPASGVLSGSTAAVVEDWDSVEEPQPQGSFTL